MQGTVGYYIFYETDFIIHECYNLVQGHDPLSADQSLNSGHTRCPGKVMGLTDDPEIHSIKIMGTVMTHL